MKMYFQLASGRELVLHQTGPNTWTDFRTNYRMGDIIKNRQSGLWKFIKSEVE